MVTNAYGIESMCRAGIPIFNVFPMTTAFPPKDFIHVKEEINLKWTDMLHSYMSKKKYFKT